MFENTKEQRIAIYIVDFSLKLLAFLPCYTIHIVSHEYVAPGAYVQMIIGTVSIAFFAGKVM